MQIDRLETKVVKPLVEYDSVCRKARVSFWSLCSLAVWPSALITCRRGSRVEVRWLRMRELYHTRLTLFLRRSWRATTVSGRGRWPNRETWTEWGSGTQQTGRGSYPPITSYQPCTFGLVSSPNLTLTRGETCLVNQVKFFGLSQIFFCGQLKKSTDTRIDFTVVKEVLCNLAISLVFTAFE